jgi:hypothetical protein
MNFELTDRNTANSGIERQSASARLPERRGQSEVSLQHLVGKAVCFGTNITFPMLIDGNRIDTLKAIYQRGRRLLKHETGNDWGKTATQKASGSLIPCVKEAVKSGIFVFDCSRAYGGSEHRLAKALLNVKRED